MADSIKYRLRPASTEDTCRSSNGCVSANRSGTTSPIVISSSSGEEDGGAPLSAGFSDVDVGSASDNALYAPPHMRQSRNASLGQIHSTGARFQLGDTLDDSDVFECSNARTATKAGTGDNVHATVTRPESLAGGLPLEGSAQRQPSSYSVGRNRQITGGATFASPEPRSFGGTLRQTTSSSPLLATPVATNTTSEPRNRHQVGGIDAQAFYPPEACVFVANLPEGVDDTRLEAEVTRQFSFYGTVFVKIRRDSRNMPFAFCQFTNVEDAQRALAEGRGRIIYGRACRTENVRANRTYIMHRINGGDLDANEARQALFDAGIVTVERCEPLPLEIQEQQGLSRSVLIKLSKYDPAKEVHQAFKQHAHFRISPYDEHKHTRAPRPDPAIVWLNRYEVDRRSVFIGNLPTGLVDLDDQLRQILGDVGDIVDLQIITRESRNGAEPRIFGFAEFTHPDMAALAVDRFNGHQFWERTIRIERKASRDVTTHQAPRYTSSARVGNDYQSPSSNRFERSKYGMHSPETPLRSDTRNTVQLAQSPAGTPMSVSQNWGNPFGHRDWSSPPPAHYSTSPFANPPGSGEYQAATPQMPTPYASHAMATPYGLFPASNYQWMSPYLNDPHLAPLAWAHSYGQFSNTNLDVFGGDEEGPNTPTRNNNRDHGDESGCGRHDGDKA